MMMYYSSPLGRCLLPCGVKLKCGHACPSKVRANILDCDSSLTHMKCHPDDEYHANVRCTEPCGSLCPLGHPCGRMCFEKCKCDFIVENLWLPCGHVRKNVTW